VEQMGCPELVQEFERNLKRKQDAAQQAQAGGSNDREGGGAGNGSDETEPLPSASLVKYPLAGILTISL